MFLALHLDDLSSRDTLIAHIITNQIEQATCTEHNHNDHNDISEQLEEHRVTTAEGGQSRHITIQIEPLYLTFLHTAQT